MSLIADIDRDYKEAFKGREERRTQVLRMLRSELKNKEKDKRAELTEQEVVAVVRTAIKKREEASDAFAAGGNAEKAAGERAEAEILKVYLPQQLGSEELEALINEAIAEVGARGVGDLGNVMKAVMPKVAGRADGKTVNQVVRQALSH